MNKKIAKIDKKQTKSADQTEIEHPLESEHE